MLLSKDYLNIYTTSNQAMFLSKDYLNIYTTSNQAMQIINIMKKYLKDINKFIICDATAGIGGNAIYFCKYFDYVICIDNNEEAIEYLEKNLKKYNNNYIIEDNCFDILKIIKFDILFLDPPWGGSSYKNLEKVDLYIGDTNVLEIIDYYYNYTNFIVLKAPINYNIINREKWKYNIHKVFKNDKIKVFYNIYVFHK